MINDKIGSEVLLPDLGALRPGDIVLSRQIDGRGRKQATGIAIGTFGSFSHVLICSSPPTCIEAVGDGVATISISRCYAVCREAIRVLRYPDAAIARDAARRAQNKLGQDYSIKKAIRSAVPGGREPRPDDRGIFCSELVAQVFTEAGAPEFEKTPSHKTTPATIENMNVLQDVTDLIFKSRPIPNNVDTLQPLDGEQFASVSAPQIEINARYAADLVPIIEALMRDFPELQRRRVNTLNECMKFIFDEIEVAAEEAEAGSPPPDAFMRRVLALDATAAAHLRRGELARLFDNISRLELETFQLATTESFEDDPDIDLDHLKGLLMASALELEQRVDAAAWLRSIADKSDTARAWAELQEPVNARMAERNRLIEAILARLDRA